MIYLKAVMMIFVLTGVTKNGECQRYFYSSAPISLISPANFSSSIADAFSCASNPSLVPAISKIEAGVYCEKRYLMDDLMLMNISSAVGAGRHGIAISLQHFGGLLYNEKFATLGYGRAIGNIHLGVSFRVLGVYTKGHQTDNFIGAGFHSAWKLTDKISAAFSILNPHSLFTKMASVEVRLPAAFSSGIGYDFSKQLYGGVEAIKEEGRSASIIAALRYFFNEKYFIRATWITTGNQPFLTVGWIRKFFRIETGFRYHQVLGFSPAVILYYMPVKNVDQ